MIIPIENEQEFEEVLVRSSSGQHSSLANGGWNDFVSVPRSELAADMTCPICLEVFPESVVVLGCLDRFCAACLERCLRSQSMQSACPCCRLRIPSRRNMKPDLGFGGMIRRLQKCSGESANAPVTGDDAANGGGAGTGTGSGSSDSLVQLASASREQHEERVDQMIRMQAEKRQLQETCVRSGKRGRDAVASGSGLRVTLWPWAQGQDQPPALPMPHLLFSRDVSIYQLRLFLCRALMLSRQQRVAQAQGQVSFGVMGTNPRYFDKDMGVLLGCLEIVGYSDGITLASLVDDLGAPVVLFYRKRT